MIRAVYPRVFYHHSPNGAYLGGNSRTRQVRGGIMRGDGCKAGFPDLICIWNGGLAFMEVKRAKGAVVSDDQKAIHAMLADYGHPCAVVKSVDDAKAFLEQCGAPQG